VDTVAVQRAEETRVTGFVGDTLVRAALEGVAGVAGGGPCFEARIEKRIPVAAGLGGGSSDAAAALALASGLLDTPLSAEELVGLAGSLGADVPFFLQHGPRLGTDDGTSLAPLALPRDYVVLLVLPARASKSSTADVYAAFDRRNGELGFEERRDGLLRALETVRDASDLMALPPNDLASSPLARELRALGAFRADVTGAGPVVYGLFADREGAERARAAGPPGGAQTWIATPG
jgi:4-diphosphocytidyl-2-C-methyl-D-erythritol kinase